MGSGAPSHPHSSAGGAQLGNSRTELPAGADPAPPGLSARTRTWLFLGLCPSHGTGVWPLSGPVAAKPRHHAGRLGAGSSQPGSLGPPCPTSSADQGRGTGPRGRGRRWALSLLIYDKDVRGSCAYCGSRAVCVSAKKRLQTSGVRPRGRPSENCWACRISEAGRSQAPEALSGSRCRTAGQQV